MALDNLLVLDGRGQPYSDRRLRSRLVKSVESALTSASTPALPGGEPQRRSTAFEVAPSVAIADRASTRTTVVEINARDRPALLAALAAAIHACGHVIHSAHIATYGERAVDVFYLTRADGKKLTEEDGEQLRAALLDAAREPAKAKAA
jgi:[protein-PII] uridylyltransferase